jgi:hypothetical protein
MMASLSEWGHMAARPKVDAATASRIADSLEVRLRAMKPEQACSGGFDGDR